MPAQTIASATHRVSDRTTNPCTLPSLTDPARRTATAAPRPDTTTPGCADSMAAAGVDWTRLTYGQLAVALHLGGLPTTWQRMTTDQLCALASMVFATIGPDEVRRLDAISRQAVSDAFAAHDRDPYTKATAQWARVDAVWSSARAHQRATNAAYILRHHLDTIPAYAWRPAA
jgi:hypothetical protein